MVVAIVSDENHGSDVCQKFVNRILKAKHYIKHHQDLHLDPIPGYIIKILDGELDER
jgi:hypothetical protein